MINYKRKFILFFSTVFFINIYAITGCSESDDVKKKNNNVITEDTVNWNKKYSGNGNENDKPCSVAIDSNNNVYIAGYGSNIVNNYSEEDWWIKKFDNSGNEDTVNWNKKFDSGVTSAMDGAYAIAVDSNDNVYVAGTGDDLIDLLSGMDCWIKKFGTNGNEDTVNWDKKYDEEYSAYCITIDSQDNVYVGGHGYWIKKFSSSGVEDTVNWNKNYNDPGELGYKGRVMSMAVDSEDNIYAAGYGWDLVSSKSTCDWWIKKFSSGGVEDTANWNKKINGRNTSADYACSLSIDSSGNIYVAGYSNGLVDDNGENENWWIKKFSASGVEDTASWNKTYSGYGYGARAISLVVDSNDNVFITGDSKDLSNGHTDLNCLIRTYRSDGTYIGSITLINYGNEDSVYSAAVDYEDNIYIAGSKWNLISDSSEYDWWIKKFIKK